jgi:hypothetical protein
MDERLLAIALTATKNPTYDSLWQSFGYPKRPGAGGFFSPKPDWKKALEDRITLQIIYSSVATSFIAEKIVDDSSINEIIEILKSFPIEGLNFDNAYECIRYYLNNSTESWASYLQTVLNVNDIPDLKLKMQLLTRIPVFCLQSQHAINGLSMEVERRGLS